MHLLVLSAFRLEDTTDYAVNGFMSQCTFWCSVLSDKTKMELNKELTEGLNAPFGAQCFPTLQHS